MDLIENNKVDTAIIRHPWELARFNIIYKNVKSIIKKNNGKCFSIIDIGCGDSFVISTLSNFIKFEEILAIDINFTKDQVEKLKLEHNKILFYNNLSEVEINSNYYYIILLNDVIEHVENDIDFLKYIDQTIIKKTTQSSFFITVPAFNYLFSQHDLDLGHFRRYETSNLIQYNNILNLKIDKTGYFFFLLYLARAVERKINKVKSKNTNIGVSSWNHNVFITKLIELLLLLDFNIGLVFNKMKIKLPGLSTYIIFSKNV
jgi:hypothetical protein